MRRHRGCRVGVLAWAVFQLALSSVLACADARSERPSAGARNGHIEASSRSTCRPLHSDECPLCQFLSDLSAPVRRPAFAAATPPIDRPPLAIASMPVASRVPGTAPARAPPNA
ncbi:MAG TPA: hypothetical protein VGG84_09180 [Gemmatimonadaceae bacterium]